MITVDGGETQANLVLLPLNEFDVILGMDWLSRHRAKVDCYEKAVIFEDSGGKTYTFRGIRRVACSKVISALAAIRLLKKGCQAFLAHVIDTSRGEPKLEDIPVVREYPDVFPNDLPGLPP